MAQIVEGMLNGTGSKHALVVGRFNELINRKLLEGAIDGLVRHGVSDDDITVVWVPGAFEIPLVTKKLAKSGKYDTVIALGSVIRGSTPHFDYVSAEATKGIATMSLKYQKPVSFGLLTTDTIEQAIERAGTKAGNKGFEAMTVAIEMLDLYENI
jgi:6,7-dimethyl-8-ribityllumazine synthase